MQRRDLRLSFECDADWGAMPGDARVRHCARCDTSVTNLSALSEVEVRALLAQKGPAPCVRYQLDDDGAVQLRRPASPMQRLAGSLLVASSFAGITACTAPDSRALVGKFAVQRTVGSPAVPQHIESDAGAPDAAVPDAAVPDATVAREKPPAFVGKIRRRPSTRPKGSSGDK